MDSLQCFQCASTASMDDCSSQQISTTCPASLSSAFCAKVQVKDESGGVQSFAKGIFSDRLLLKLLYMCNIKLHLKIGFSTNEKIKGLLWVLFGQSVVSKTISVGANHKLVSRWLQVNGRSRIYLLNHSFCSFFLFFHPHHRWASQI